ncbi:hypothetical protein AALB52_18375 [Lachnospiraceae bacterium 38-14]
MKKKFSIITLLAIITISLTGCSKYEKDKSYDTDLYGTYSDYWEASNISYSQNESYTFNADNTYNHIYKEIMDGNINNNIDKNGKILSTEEISNDITQITLDQEIVDWSTGEKSNDIIYKYKNMIGNFLEIEVPKGKTFKLQLSDYVWYDEEGQYHVCNGDDCQCEGSSPKYVRKNNIIYFQSMDEEHKDCYTIGCYIVDDGLFTPELYKAEEQ